jgi:hypothetical protein
MNKFILSVMLIGLVTASFKTQTMESITVGVTQNATLLATAGALAGGLGMFWFAIKEGKSFAELELGKEVNIDLLNRKHEITSQRISTTKGIFNLLKNSLGLLASSALYLKAAYYLRENVFNKKNDPNALSPIDAACLVVLYPALGIGIPALIAAIQDTDAAYKAYDENEEFGCGDRYSRQANAEFKLFTGATAMVALTLLVKAIADKALTAPVAKVVA